MCTWNDRAHRGAGCGEGAMETRIRRLDGRDLCHPCFDAALSPDQPVLLRGAGR